MFRLLSGGGGRQYTSYLENILFLIKKKCVIKPRVMGAGIYPSLVTEFVILGKTLKS